MRFKKLKASAVLVGGKTLEAGWSITVAVAGKKVYDEHFKSPPPPVVVRESFPDTVTLSDLPEDEIDELIPVPEPPTENPSSLTSPEAISVFAVCGVLAVLSMVTFQKLLKKFPVFPLDKSTNK